MIVNVYKFGGDIGVMKSFKGEGFACGSDKSQHPFHRLDHSALMSRLAMYSETEANFFRLKTPCLPLKGKETPSINHRWRWTVPLWI